MEVISSRRNPLVQAFRAVARGERPRDMLLDGAHLVQEARQARVAIETAAVSTARLGAADSPLHTLLDELRATGVRLVQVSPDVMDALSPVRSPSGIVAIAARPATAGEALFAQGPALVVVLAGVQDPGNVGATVRAADAGGATGVVAAGATADPFGWKALRGAMGSAFHLPILATRETEAALAMLRARGVQTFATGPHDGRSMYDTDLRRPIAFLLGSEGAGLPAEIARRADGEIHIPMRERIDSLNVAVAAALLVYEARRQRQGG